jgi:hypothetical protein
MTRFLRLVLYSMAPGFGIWHGELQAWRQASGGMNIARTGHQEEQQQQEMRRRHRRLVKPLLVALGKSVSINKSGSVCVKVQRGSGFSTEWIVALAIVAGWPGDGGMMCPVRTCTHPASCCQKSPITAPPPEVWNKIVSCRNLSTSYF